MNSVWKIREPNCRLQKSLSSEIGVTPIVSQVLINRNIKTAEEAELFLFGGIDHCHDPFIIKNMTKSVSRVKSAINKKEKILVYGDYDVDGVTGASLLSLCLAETGADFEAFIPHRVEDGYGLNVKAIKMAKDKSVKVLITVDCGINSFKEIKLANEYGIDVIVTDHHAIRSPELPDAYAVINLHQEGCPYPFKDLAGVGVAYKFARALFEGHEDLADSHLDLVALGSIADMAPMTGENRILIKAGLKRLRNTKNTGIKALIDVSRIRQETLGVRDVGFSLGPRINAMGRVGSAETALKLLTCADKNLASELALTLNKENQNRQSIEKNLLKEAVNSVNDKIGFNERKVIVLAGDNWHQGVLGIVASRLTDEYDVPAIMISLDGENGKGSGRSVDGFNLFEAINSSREHLVDFGGHEAACGIKIKRENIELFSKALNREAEKFFVNRVESSPCLDIDARVNLSDIGLKLINELELLTPYGDDNKEPVFASVGIGVKNIPREIGRAGLKFFVTDGAMTVEAVTFKKNKIERPKRGDIINLAYTPSINRWSGIDSIQLNIKDIENL